MKPNVILVMTDDQGYGDLGCTGNPWIRTPNIDQFCTESVRCNDFHVSPLCTPTRGGIMTGHRPIRNGAWGTAWGRSIVQRDEMMMPEVFANSGYCTAMFGKWHLGDNYPYRPEDRGFQTVIAHKGGGVGQTPDFWGNSYFDDTYFHNGTPQEHNGYCTDVWFDEAIDYIRDHKDSPFFVYIATNAPHGPYLVDEKYSGQYKENPDIPEPNFYGMITNIDENFGRLRQELNRLELAENTILIFMTDNGSSGGYDERTGRGYNAAMRGTKASFYDGGHRVPFFIQWPVGGIVNRDVDELLDHVDLIPTFTELCDLTPPRKVEYDGISVAPVLLGKQEKLPERFHFVQNRQHWEVPEKWHNAVMTKRWRLVYGTELYDIKVDPGQQNDIAAEHPDVVAKLRQAHEEWWAEASPCLGEHLPHILGNDHENPTRLDSMDIMGDCAWNQIQVRKAMKITSRWKVEVERAGRYRMSMRRWPRELRIPITDTPTPTEKELPIIEYRYHPDQDVTTDVHVATPFIGARLEIGGQEQRADVTSDMEEVSFELDLHEQTTDLEAFFIDETGEEWGAYYVYIERLD